METTDFGDAESFRCEIKCEIPELKVDQTVAIISYDKLKEDSKSLPGISKKELKCGTCKKQLSTLQNLQIHERIHTGEKPFECKACGRNFTQNQTLKKH